MGTGYTRNDAANNIADGNIINASDLDGEFDAVESAFNSSSGHTHDGTSAEGAPIEVIGPTQDVVITASALRPKTTNTVDLGTASLEFKDAFFDGTVTTDALAVTAGITSNVVTVSSDNAGSAKGPQLDILRDSSSPADSDAIGHIDFSGKDDGDNKTIYASILASIGDVTDGTEDGTLKFNTMVAGSDTTVITVKGGLVGIGTSAPSSLLELVSDDATNTGVTQQLTLTHTTTGTAGDGIGTRMTFESEDDGGTKSTMGHIDTIFTDVSDGAEKSAFVFSTRNGGSISEAMRISSNGKVFIGNTITHQYDAYGDDVKLQLESAGTSPYAGFGMLQNSNDADPAPLIFGKSRGTSIGSTTIVQDGDTLGRIEFQGMDGADLETGASIFGQVDGTPGANDMPGRLVFNTTADGAHSATERMRIDSSGNVGIGATAPAHKLDIVESADAFGVRITNNSDGSQGLQVRTSDNDTGQYILDLQTSSSATGTNYASKFVVEKGGNVGIGTTSPGNFNGLTFNGNFLSVDGPLQVKSTNDSVSVIGLGGDTYRKASIASANGTDDGYLAFAVATAATSSAVSEVGRWLSGGGLTFNGDTAAVNALDDYEEGTFTPSIGSGAGSGGGASGATGSYTKIGNRVFAECHMSISTLGSMSGTFFVTGFPFAASSSYRLSQGTVRSQGIGGSNNLPLAFEMSAGNNFGRFHFMSGTSTQLTVAVSQLSASDFFAIGITYNV